MGAILSNLESLPADDAADRARVYAGVYSDLTRLGHPLPAAAPDQITHAELLAHLQQRIGALVQSECFVDPLHMYTPGATDEQLCEALHAPAANGPPRICDVLMGFPFAPNALTVDDVASARR